MSHRQLHDGRSDGLAPLESLDLNEVRSFRELLRAMSKTAFSGRQLGEAFEILLEMASDSSCRLVLTVSGAMTVAKQGRIFCDMIDRGLVSAVVATGALMAHGLSESLGLVHYRYDSASSDEELYRQGYNRIYDTLEMEANLNEVGQIVASILDENMPPDSTWSSSRFCRELGRRLSETDQGPGILRSAYEQQVPVFIPAFTDSEMGLDVLLRSMDRSRIAPLEKMGRAGLHELLLTVPAFNPFLDLREYVLFASEAKGLGIFTIGGGVPRNWAQQIAPFFDIASARLGLQLECPRFRYGVRICPEPPHWGGLSGCNYSEGVSWGKFVPPSQGGRYAEVYADATTALPLLMKAVFEELGDMEV
jgi:deoxyhypusine synthase